MDTIRDVVIGAGPVGTTIATQLVEQGRPVRLLTRSGKGAEHLDDHPLVERLSVDAADPATLALAVSGATTVFDCMHGSSYSARAWRAELPRAERAVMDAAAAVEAVVVFPESLYSFGRTEVAITEDLPREASRGKLGIRTDLLRARTDHQVPTVSVAASDFYGPYVRNAHASERMVRPVLTGGSLRVLGDPDAPHSWTYVPDLAAAMIRAADDASLWNSFLLAPTAAPLSQRDLTGQYAAAAGVTAPPVKPIPRWLLRTAGLVSAPTRELAETAYMFERRFEVDSSASESRLGLAPTPLENGVKETIAWWQEN